MRMGTMWGVILLAAAGMAYGETGSPGSLDWVESVEFGASNDIAFGVATDANGNLVVAGAGRFAEQAVPNSPVPDQRLMVARYTASGALDTSFGTGGFVEVAFDVPEFGDDPVRPAHAVDVAIDGNGRIVVVGAVYDVVTRTVTSGKGKNKTTTSTYAMGDSRIAVARLLPTGAYDSGFSGDGRDVQAVSGATNAIARSVAVLSNGDLIVAGGGDFESTSSQQKKGRGTGTQTTGGAILLRYTSAGVLDTNFGGGDGVVIDDASSGDDEITIDGMDVQPGSGRIVTLQYSNVVRAYSLSTGAPIDGFGYAPAAGDTLDRLVVDAGDNESILVCGSRRLADNSADGLVSRLSPAGAHEWSTTVDVADNCWIRGIRVDGAGNVIGAAGAHEVMTGGDGRDVFVVRMSSTGTNVELGERTTPLDGDSWEFAHDLALTGSDIVLVGDVHDLGAGTQDWFIAAFSGS
jgi:uncharacterized delta-60 repeat protein